MKIVVLLLLLCCGLAMPTPAAEEMLIPAALNSLLPKIHPGMTTNDVVKVLSTSYPKLLPQMGDWSGGSGYNEYKLDKRFTLAITFISHSGQEVVHSEHLMSLFDWQEKRRIDIRLHKWDKESPKTPAQK